MPKAVNRSGCAINTTARSAIRSRDLAHCSAQNMAVVSHIVSELFMPAGTSEAFLFWVVENDSLLLLLLWVGGTGVRLTQLKGR